METQKRRCAIYEDLKETTRPIKGIELAKKYGVSRQVIVQDIALLRAKGHQVIATPTGYMIQEMNTSSLLKTIYCQHEQTIEAMKEELELIISYGGKVIDVTVDHPVYHEIKVMLNLRCQQDINEFIQKVSEAKTQPLSLLTAGIHAHTIAVENEEMYENIYQSLKKRHFLIPSL